LYDEWVFVVDGVGVGCVVWWDVVGSVVGDEVGYVFVYLCVFVGVLLYVFFVFVLG